MQARPNSCALTKELRLSCTNPSNFKWTLDNNMACCHIAPSHYPIKRWFVTNNITMKNRILFLLSRSLLSSHVFRNIISEMMIRFHELIKIHLKDNVNKIHINITPCEFDVAHVAINIVLLDGSKYVFCCTTPLCLDIIALQPNVELHFNKKFN